RDGRRLAFRLTTTTDAAREQLAQLFQSDMQALGIQITIEQRAGPVLFAGQDGLAHRNVELALFAWSSPPDPDLASLYTCDMIPGLENRWAGHNWMGWCNQRASAALIQARLSLTRQGRKQQYAVAQAEFRRD